jgi:signal transduction histidine kinase
VRGFRTRVLVAMMLLVTAVTALAVFLADRNLTATMQRELGLRFDAELAALRNAEAVRHAALVERCHALVRKPRIHAALEDNALDLLYPSAEDELKDIVAASDDEAADNHGATVLRARFYRFLGRDGAVISPASDHLVGALPPNGERSLTLPRLTNAQQLGYVASAPASSGVTEIIATPILSTETGEPIAALVLGFRPLEVTRDPEMRTGIWVGGELHLIKHDAELQRLLRDVLDGKVRAADAGSVTVALNGVPHAVFYRRANSGSDYPPAFEVSIFPMSGFAARRTTLRTRIVSIGALLLVGAFFAGRVLSARLSAPVEQLAIDSERSARFSADASHQLKTPVTVLRAGLEELLTRQNLSPEECDSIAALIHQTYRLSSLVDDLLLLSRMDSGRLKLAFAPVDLAHLIAAAVDDVSAIPDGKDIDIETEVAPDVAIQGESRYTAIILQNLLENARKYNRPGGRIRVTAHRDEESVYLAIGNTGSTIAPAAQARIFERFHRGAMGENIPGYGLGLNLARELARLHDGELRLVRSADDWTEFEVRFRAMPASR